MVRRTPGEPEAIASEAAAETLHDEDRDADRGAHADGGQEVCADATVPIGISCATWDEEYVCTGRVRDPQDVGTVCISANRRGNARSSVRT